MALLGKFGADYTKTGGNWFSRMSGYASYIPFGVGAVLAGFFGTIGTIIETGSWLLRGKVSSALTAAAAGTVATTVNSVGSIAGLTWGSFLLTGRSFGTHTRKLTEAGVGAVTGVVGIKPQVLSSYTAGLGSIGGMQQGPGRFMQQEAMRRGEDPNAAYARLNSNQGDHVAALQSAQQQQSYLGR